MPSALIGRTPALVFALLIATACGGGNGDPDGTPTTPTSPTPPPSGVPAVSGNWNGTADFERPNNVHLITSVALTVNQNDRNIDGTVRFPSPGWESWRGTFAGTLSGTVDPEFVGIVSLEAEPTTGSGVCRGQMIMSGRVLPTSMRWDSSTLTMAPTVPSEAPACLGTVRNIAWIFNR